MSSKTIAPSDRLIFAMDVPDTDQARALANTLGDAVSFYKLGLELAMSGGYFELIEWLRDNGKKIFADIKFYDIPATVGRAVRRLSGHGVTYATVHGDRAIMQAAAEASGEIEILAVTVLTSLDDAGLRDLGYAGEVAALVLTRARHARDAGCAGVIASPLDAAMLRENLGEPLKIVTPGIRPAVNRPADDQKRVATVEQAFADGADHIVVGRPIRDAEDPRAAAEAIQQRIAGIFPS